MYIEGIVKVVSVLDTQKGTSDKGPWERVNYLLETSEMNPRKVVAGMFLSNENCGQRLPLNQITKLRIAISARQTKDGSRWFNDVSIIKVLPIQ